MSHEGTTRSQQAPQPHQADGQTGALMSFWDHLEELRLMLFRIIAAAMVVAIVLFCAKEWTFRMLLAPTSTHFITYRAIEQAAHWVGIAFHFEPFSVQLINTELSSQFMTHVSTSFYLGLLFTSPYVMVELFRFITPALYENERRHSVAISVAIYLLFILGVLMSYFVLFPFAFRFLGTYQVSAQVVNQINLSSYVTTFTSLTLMMGLVFQIPVLSFFLAKLGLLTAAFMRRYRRHALVLIMVVAAIITPPDLFTLVMVTLPMYALYELSILIVRRTEAPPAAPSTPHPGP